MLDIPKKTNIEALASLENMLNPNIEYSVCKNLGNAIYETVSKH